MVVNYKSPSKCLPITTSEFYSALRAIWNPIQGPGMMTARFGIAVSGGVDSMAMASLCATLNRARDLEHNVTRIKFQAFIVNHGVRPDSLAEATWVKQQLNSWGLTARILDVKWPQDGDAQQLSNFETLARKLRYQALGRACLDRNIQSLLVAHHQDDQAETVMMRIVEGHRGAGLKGMLPVSDIPECWAIHGVHQSGAGEAAEKTVAAMKIQESFQRLHSQPLLPNLRGKKLPPSRIDEGAIKTYRSSNLEGKKLPPLRIEEGGVKIYRPFLDFDKERLRATCRASRVAWVEDETNQNPALTHRNAVRKLLQLGGLPKAIQKASLLALASRAHRSHEAQMMGAEGQFRLCMIDTRIGVAMVRVNRRVIDCSRVPAMYLHRAVLRKQRQCALVVRRMMQMVTPVQAIPLGNVFSAVKALFPKRVDPTSAEQTCKLTCGGVHFERVRSHRKPARSPTIDPEFVWILTRQPFTAGRPSPILTFRRVIAPNKGSEFSLWDGRFWFRIVNRHSRPVVIRPFYPADLTLLRATLPKEQARDLDEALRVVAPGKLRWTLPVIAEAEENRNEAEEGSRQHGAADCHESEEDIHEAEEGEDIHEAEEGEDNHLKADKATQEAKFTSSSNTTPNAIESESETKRLISTPNPPNNKQNKNPTKTKKPSQYTKYSDRTGGLILALPTLNHDFGAQERGVEWEVRYKKVTIPKQRKFETIIL